MKEKRVRVELEQLSMFRCVRCERKLPGRLLCVECRDEVQFQRGYRGAQGVALVAVVERSKAGRGSGKVVDGLVKGGRVLREVVGAIK